MKQSESTVDFVLVTALEEERDAVLGKLPGYRRLPPTRDDIRVYFEANVPVAFADGALGNYRIIVMPLNGMGRVQATAAAGDAIRRWEPRYIVLVGIAGGIADRGIDIGDILVSDQIADYELQKITDARTQLRWTAHQVDQRLLAAARNFRAEDCLGLLTERRPEPGATRRHIGPIASGDKVMASSQVLAQYTNGWPALIGIEMEAGGVAVASLQAPIQPGFFMIRGVSDLADESKGSELVERWRPYACDVAASYAIALLESGPVPPADVAYPGRTRPIDARAQAAGLLDHTPSHLVVPVAFFDPEFPCSWVSDPDAIAAHFTDQGFVTLGAQAIAAVMELSIERHAAQRVLIVFIHDVVPVEVAQVLDPSCTLRRFLDAGGRVVWWGDIPLHWRGRSPRMKEQWAAGPTILGVSHYMPRYRDRATGAPGSVALWDRADLDATVQLTEAGRGVGLAFPGLCLRPAAVDENVTVYSEVAGDLGFGRQFEGFRWAVSWRKNFNPEYPLSGFMQYPCGQVSGKDPTALSDFLKFAISGLPVALKKAV